MKLILTNNTIIVVVICQNQNDKSIVDAVCTSQIEQKNISICLLYDIQQNNAVFFVKLGLSIVKQQFATPVQCKDYTPTYDLRSTQKLR